ncbi:MAG TPA: spore gernimation protein [Clostridiaceae bacterium]|nr:spore gernimation protein [Clostridiaceae bacterium]
MQIYVVKSGDTLFSIARMFSIPLERLIQSNMVPNPDDLVVGQTLVIPIWGSYHFVEPGESLYQIGRQYNIPVSEILRINSITDPNKIYAGMRLYIPQRPRMTVDVGAYIDPLITGPERAPSEIDKVADNLTYLSIFKYAVRSDGSITTDIQDQPLINAAYRHRTVPLMVLTNFEGGTFKRELATTILSNPSLQDKVLDQAISTMTRKGYLGLDFDFEYLGAENRERYTDFLRKAAERLRQRNFFISAALAPKISGDQKGILYEGHDYKAIGEIVDFIFFMTYEWGWSGGPPLPVAPIDQVRRVMEYAISVVPKDKIMMGIPLYGYDWTLPYVPGGKFAESIGMQEAIMRAARNNVAIQYDTTAQSPHYNYTDSQGRRHEVWFEDARSIQAKFNLVKELGIRGFYYWVLGKDFPQNWLLLQDNFIVRKRV